MKSLRGASFLLLVLLPFASRAANPFRSDSPAHAGIAMHQVGTLVYPPEMLYEGVLSGTVRVVISVDEKGQLVDHLVVAYTDRGFVETAVSALRRWTYEPAITSGRAQSARAEVQFVFKDRGVIVQRLPGAAERMFLSEVGEARFAYRPSRLRDLDRIPTPVHVVNPAVRFEGQSHTVTIGFYIDEEGRVRMPAVERESADDMLAAAAVAAVEQWRFEPPLRKGRPVLVYAQQDFTFKGRE